MFATESPVSHFARYVAVAGALFGALFALVWIKMTWEPLAYRSGDFAVALARYRIVEAKPPMQLCAFGDSCAATGIIPARLGPQVYNFALAGASPVEEYFLARKVMDLPVPPKALIISFTAYHFTTSDVFWSTTVQGSGLNDADFESVRRTSRALGDNTLFGPESPGDLDARLKLFLYSIHFPAFDFPSLLASLDESRYEKNRMLLDQIIQAHGYVAAPVSPMRGEADLDAGLKDFKPSKLMDYYFDQLLSLADSRNVEAYYVQSPRSPVSVARSWPGLASAEDRYLANYAARYPHFHVTEKCFVVFPADDFADQVHLNSAGSVKWTDHIADLLNAAKASGSPYPQQ